MIQEFRSPSGTGKTTQFIPFQMELNIRNGCNRFFVIGRGDSYKSFFTRYLKNKLGWRYFFSNKKNVRVTEFDIKPYLPPHKIGDFRIDMEIFLNSNRDEKHTNIIIDDCSDLTMIDEEAIINIVNERKFKILTLVDSK